MPEEMIQEPVHLGDRVEVLAVATGVLHRQAVAVCAVADGRLLTWHLDRGELAAPPVVVGADSTSALAVGLLDGRLVAVCGTGRQVRMWDVAEADPVGPALLGHDEDVTAVALGELGGAPMVASGAVDGLHCVWDASSGEPLREPIQGQDGELVEAVLIERLLGRDALISTGWNDQVEAWDLASGSPVRTPAGSVISWRADDMEPIALGLAGGRPTALFTGEVEGPLIGTVEAVDVATGQVTGQLAGPGSGHAGAVRAGAFVTGLAARRRSPPATTSRCADGISRLVDASWSCAGRRGWRRSATPSLRRRTGRSWPPATMASWCSARAPDQGRRQPKWPIAASGRRESGQRMP